VNSSDTPDVSRERETVVAQNMMIACGVAVALVVPGASALATGGQGGVHRATPMAASHGHRDGHKGGPSGGAHGRAATHGQSLRQFEGVIVTVAPESLALRVQGSPGVTVTVGLSLTGTRVTADDIVTTTAVLASGQQVHVAAASATTNGATTYTAVRIVIQRRDADATADTDTGPDTGGGRHRARHAAASHDVGARSEWSSGRRGRSARDDHRSSMTAPV